MGKCKTRAAIYKQISIAEGIYDMWIQVPTMAEISKPGQFISVYVPDGTKLLPRPISICEISEDKEMIRLVYRVTSKSAGTEILAKLGKGDYIDILGPLGNGFPLESQETVLIGGGIGIPPMLELCKELVGKVTVVLGYRDADLFLVDDFKLYTDNIIIATEDGSIGTKGNVIDAITAAGIEPKTIMSCGPTPMLRAIKQYAAERGIDCYVSLEEKMACGIGACLACVCKSTSKDEHTNVNNKRVCKDGPVFNANEVDI